MQPPNPVPKGGHALLILRLHYGEGRVEHLCLDATTRGNIGRFVNHGCDPNAFVELLHTPEGPRVLLWALKDIQGGEEVVFDYGDARSQPSGTPCLCGSPKCRGFLPREPGL